MKKVALTLLTAVPLLALGCTSERQYTPYDSDVEPYLLAEVFGEVGNLTDIENRFATEPDFFSFDTQREAYIERYDNELWANMVAEHPQGRVYLDVSVFNIDQMEEGRDYTVALDNGYTTEGAYSYSDADAADSGEPSVSVYACPETLTGADPGSASGTAEEITVRLERPYENARPRLVFDASADNADQHMYLDGWVTADPQQQSGI